MQRLQTLRPFFIDLIQTDINLYIFDLTRYIYKHLDLLKPIVHLFL